MSREVKVTLSKKSAEALANIILKLGLIKKEDYEKEVKKNLKPQKALFG